MDENTRATTTTATDLDVLVPNEHREKIATAYEGLRDAMRDSNLLLALFNAQAACESFDRYVTKAREDGARDLPWEMLSELRGYEKVDDLFTLLGFWYEAHIREGQTDVDGPMFAHSDLAERHGLGTIAGNRPGVESLRQENERLRKMVRAIAACVDACRSEVGIEHGELGQGLAARPSAHRPWDRLHRRRPKQRPRLRPGPLRVSVSNILDTTGTVVPVSTTVDTSWSQSGGGPLTGSPLGGRGAAPGPDLTVVGGPLEALLADRAVPTDGLGLFDAAGAVAEEDPGVGVAAGPVVLPVGAGEEDVGDRDVTLKHHLQRVLDFLVVGLPT